MDKHKEHGKHQQREKSHFEPKDKIKESFDIPDEVLERKMENEKISEERRKEEQRKLQRRESDKTTEDLKNKLIAENEKLREEVASLKDTMMRRQADFENYKKRIFKQQAETRTMAIRDFALDVILINDDLLRAVEASEAITKNGSTEDSHKSFLEGVVMISKRIEEILKKYNVIEIDSLNREFDPNFHEAVEIEQLGGVERDTVSKVYHKGFRIDDLVVRSAKVKVTKPKRDAVPDVSSDDHKDTNNGKSG
jgi:molecular chaperone GrpE